MILKTSNRNVWSNVFWYVKVCIFWMCIQYTIHWDKTQMLTKFSSDKINGSKNALFFLSPAPIYYSFTFNLRFLYELKHKVCLSKTVCGIFHFWFRFVLYYSLYFCSATCMDSLTLQYRNSYQNWNNKKATHGFASSPLIFKLQQEVLQFNEICVSWRSRKYFFENDSFSQ